MKITVCKGCKAQMMATDQNGNPACPVCCGLSPDSGVPEEIEAPNTAHCIYCKHEAPNTGNLAHYDGKTNSYYCGCRGWD